MPDADEVLVLAPNASEQFLLPKLKPQKLSPNQGKSASVGGESCNPSREVARKIGYTFLLCNLGAHVHWEHFSTWTAPSCGVDSEALSVSLWGRHLVNGRIIQTRVSVICGQALVACARLCQVWGEETSCEGVCQCVLLSLSSCPG